MSDGRREERWFGPGLVIVLGAGLVLRVLYVQGQDYFIIKSRFGEAPNPDADTFAFSFVRNK